MKYCFDLDETICITPATRNYSESLPHIDVVNKINNLFDDGHHITIFTARGGSSGIDYYDMTNEQMKRWGLKFHRLICKKPDYDIFIDDKAVNASEWRKKNGIKIVGLIASSFDLLHAGHCLLLKESKTLCDYLIAALHEDPSIEREFKNKPIQSMQERKIQLNSSKYVDEIIEYKTEKDLEVILSKIRPDVRVLGSDCKNKKITGHEYCKSIYFHDRYHNWSSSELRKRLHDENL